MRPIILIGLMGAGKTTVGRMLSRRLRAPFLDSDHEIAARTGVPVPTIFEIEGEEGFRRREAQTIDILTQEKDIVLATGGGAILDAHSRECMHLRGKVIYLYAPPEVLYERTRNDRSRPLLQVDDRLKTLKDLYVIRDPLYRETAHIIIEVGSTPATQVVRNILQALRSCENSMSL